MSVSADQIEAARDLFAGLGDISTRKMMGGLCLYCDGTLFALMHSDGQLYLKGRDAFGAELEAAGCAQWTETTKTGKLSRMPYWTLPEAAVDDPDLACEWARRALAHL